MSNGVKISLPKLSAIVGAGCHSQREKVDVNGFAAAQEGKNLGWSSPSAMAPLPSFSTSVAPNKLSLEYPAVHSSSLRNRIAVNHNDRWKKKWKLACNVVRAVFAMKRHHQRSNLPQCCLQNQHGCCQTPGCTTMWYFVQHNGYCTTCNQLWKLRKARQDRSPRRRLRVVMWVVRAVLMNKRVSVAKAMCNEITNRRRASSRSESGDFCGGSETTARLTRLDMILKHSASCQYALADKPGCSTPKCGVVRRLNLHALKHNIGVQGCKKCISTYSLLLFHAQRCEEQSCAVLRCDAVKGHLLRKLRASFDHTTSSEGFPSMAPSHSSAMADARPLECMPTAPSTISQGYPATSKPAGQPGLAAWSGEAKYTSQPVNLVTPPPFGFSESLKDRLCWARVDIASPWCPALYADLTDPDIPPFVIKLRGVNETLVKSLVDDRFYWVSRERLGPWLNLPLARHEEERCDHEACQKVRQIIAEDSICSVSFANTSSDPLVADIESLAATRLRAMKSLQVGKEQNGIARDASVRKQSRRSGLKDQPEDSESPVGESSAEVGEEGMSVEAEDKGQEGACLRLPLKKRKLAASC